MPQDPTIGFHKLITKFFSDHVQHTTFKSNSTLGRRKQSVLTNWYQKRELGHGYSGIVWLEVSDTQEVRAVKVIKKGKLDYNRELEAMAKLTKHEELFVQFYGWFESEDRIHIAMEYIRHGDLDDYLEVKRSEAEAIAIARQLLEGLAVMHKYGFAHRDLKPKNILVVSTSPIWVKIADFGMAKLAKEGTVFRTAVWSENYTAPEAAGMSNSGTSEYTNAVDIWSLGCITHKILTQVTPFPCLLTLFQYCGNGEFPRAIMLSKNVSSQGIGFVEHLLVLAPAGRATAEEALESAWLQAEDDKVMEPRNEGLADQPMSERPTVGEGLLPYTLRAMKVEFSSPFRRDPIVRDISSPPGPGIDMTPPTSRTAPTESSTPPHTMAGSRTPELLRAGSQHRRVNSSCPFLRAGG